jgi:hypothetical protein
VQPQNHPHQEQLIQQEQQQLHEQQLAQQHAQQHALQPYPQPYPQQPEVKGEDILNNLSKVIEHQLAEVAKKTEMLAKLKGQLDLINNSGMLHSTISIHTTHSQTDKDTRLQLEQKRAQLQADQQHFTEQLRNVTIELGNVELLIKNTEDEKRHKIEDLYRNFQSNGVLAIAN